MVNLLISIAIACNATTPILQSEIFLPVLMAETDSEGSVVRGRGRGKAVEGADNGTERLDKGQQANKSANRVGGSEPTKSA